MSTVIKVENLSKRYYLSHQQKENFPTLRDAITRTASNLGRRLLHPLRASSGQPLEGLDSTEEFWALDDVSFEVKQGDRVGIIGRNGAGKSTLLKILSRITEPTKGRVSIKGRVASLLEVGTGFHPELTGRENIFLNGAILGMTRVEIKRKFDEIVDFAEIEKFLDTPVKRYSSGMYVRLAFAVAAHLEPEILIVDEVLAVGDAQFQKKCLGKMEEVGKEGRTVLFVSHNLSAVRRLCARSLWIDRGQVSFLGDTEKTIQSYLSSSIPMKEGIVKFKEQQDKPAYISSVELLDEGNNAQSSFLVNQLVKVKVTFVANRRFTLWRVYVDLKNPDGTIIFSTTTQDNRDVCPIERGIYSASLIIPSQLLLEGPYLLSVAFGEPPTKRHDYHENAIVLNLCGTSFVFDRKIGFLSFPFEWELEDELDDKERC